MNAYETAVALTKLGYCTLPLRHGDKHPGETVGSWTRYQTAAPTLTELAEWNERGLFEGVGIVTGEISGVLVLDVDSADGLQWVREQGVPICPEVRSGGGVGRHFYFSIDELAEQHPRNKARIPVGVEGVEIDTRANGGFVVVPPSIHASGAGYEWVAALWEFEKLPPCPVWLADLVVGAKKLERDPARSKRTGRSIARRAEPHRLTEPRTAWHGGPVTIDDVTDLLWRWVRQGNYDNRYANGGIGSTFRVWAAIVYECARLGLGLDLTMRVTLASPLPPKRDGSGRGWAQLKLKRGTPYHRLERETDSSYLASVEDGALVAVWEEREEYLEALRRRIMATTWGMRDASKLRTLLALLASIWPTEKLGVGHTVTPRQAMMFTGHSWETTEKALNALRDGQWFDDRKRDDDGLRVIDVLDPALLTPALYLSRNMNAQAFQAALHPAFAPHGSGLSIWFGMGDEPTTAEAIASLVGTDLRTALAKLDQFVGYGIATNMDGEYRRVIDFDRLDSMAVGNGGSRQLDECRNRIARERKAIREHREQNLDSNIASTVPVAGGERTRVKRDPVIPLRQNRPENTPENGAAA